MNEVFQRMCDLFNERGYEKIQINSLFNRMAFDIPEDSYWRVRKNRLEVLVHRESAEGYATVLGSERNSMEFLNNRRVSFKGGRIVEISHLDTKACLEDNFSIENMNRVAGFFIEQENERMHMGIILGGIEKMGLIGGEGVSDGVFVMKGGNLCVVSLRLYLDMTDVRIDAVKPGGKIEALLRERQWIMQMDRS